MKRLFFILIFSIPLIANAQRYDQFPDGTSLHDDGSWENTWGDIASELHRIDGCGASALTVHDPCLYEALAGANMTFDTIYNYQIQGMCDDGISFIRIYEVTNNGINVSISTKLDVDFDGNTYTISSVPSSGFCDGTLTYLDSILQQMKDTLLVEVTNDSINVHLLNQDSLEYRLDSIQKRLYDILDVNVINNDSIMIISECVEYIERAFVYENGGTPCSGAYSTDNWINDETRFDSLILDGVNTFASVVTVSAAGNLNDWFDNIVTVFNINDLKAITGQAEWLWEQNGLFNDGCARSLIVKTYDTRLNYSNMYLRNMDTGTDIISYASNEIVLIDTELSRIRFINKNSGEIIEQKFLDGDGNEFNVPAKAIPFLKVCGESLALPDTLLAQIADSIFIQNPVTDVSILNDSIKTYFNQPIEILDNDFDSVFIQNQLDSIDINFDSLEWRLDSLIILLQPDSVSKDTLKTLVWHEENGLLDGQSKIFENCQSISLTWGLEDTSGNPSSGSVSITNSRTGTTSTYTRNSGIAPSWNTQNGFIETLTIDASSSTGLYFIAQGCETLPYDCIDAIGCDGEVIELCPENSWGILSQCWINPNGEYWQIP